MLTVYYVHKFYGCKNFCVNDSFEEIEEKCSPTFFTQRARFFQAVFPLVQKMKKLRYNL